ncbi:tRNA pseudouridine(38-40) synthase TruA [Ilumatobacter sp.]|uniref:tRNA pseudouridine(38-40) synthase TruA n=1 Tax=Ilumatobacter sp. TaxID=1967498 RepID=UPI003B52E469
MVGPPGSDPSDPGAPSRHDLDARGGPDGRRNLRLLVSYDGTDFHGLAESAGVVTVMGELRRTLEQVVRAELDLTAAGRTDAGVHAWGQVVTGRFPAGVDPERLARSVNAMRRPAIAVREARWVDDDYDARFSATSRSYRYHVWSARHPNPLLARSSWHVPDRLDLDAMNAGAALLLGEHDFSSFCRRVKVRDERPEPSLVRILRHAEWSRQAGAGAVEPGGHEAGSVLRFDVAATSFCHQMVRSIVGTLVEVGRGRRSPESVATALERRDRAAAGPVAPPTGLVLWHVDDRGTRWDA